MDKEITKEFANHYIAVLYGVCQNYIPEGNDKDFCLNSLFYLNKSIIKGRKTDNDQDFEYVMIGVRQLPPEILGKYHVIDLLTYLMVSLM